MYPMGRIQIVSGVVVVGIIVVFSILLPVTAFAKTQIKFVVRMPWVEQSQKKYTLVWPVNTGVLKKAPILLPSPTLTPTPSILPTPTPTSTPIPQKEPNTNSAEEKEFIVVKESDEQNITSNYSDADSYILSKINEYRRQNGLSDVASDAQTCSFASLRAGEISSNFSHDGFNSRISSGTLPYPDYSYVNENIAQNSDFTRVTSSWIASPPHAENMRQVLTYACVRHSGEYYVFEGWRQ